MCSFFKINTDILIIYPLNICLFTVNICCPAFLIWESDHQHLVFVNSDITSYRILLCFCILQGILFKCIHSVCIIRHRLRINRKILILQSACTDKLQGTCLYSTLSVSQIKKIFLLPGSICINTELMTIFYARSLNSCCYKMFFRIFFCINISNQRQISFCIGRAPQRRTSSSHPASLSLSYLLS